MEQNDVLQRYLDRVTPVFHEAFVIAHAITDQYETAEYAVQRAIQQGFAARRKRRAKMPLNDMLRMYVIRNSIEQVRQHGQVPEGEGTWTGFDGVEGMDNPFLSEAVREPLLMRRILMMKFGAGLHSYEIAPLIGMDKKRVRGYLQQFEARVMRRMRGRTALSYEKLARRAAEMEMKRMDAEIPDIAATFRQLQSDLVDSVHPVTTSPLRRAVGMAFLVVGVVLCVFTFWLFAVLLDPGAGRGSSLPSAPVEAGAPAAPAAPVETDEVG